MIECECGNAISINRFQLGYTYCLECGEILAQEEIKRKANRVGALHKSSYQYLGDEEMAKLAIRNVGMKNVQQDYSYTPTKKLVSKKETVKVKRPFQGIKFVNGERVYK